jgi:hypothetical protein
VAFYQPRLGSKVVSNCCNLGKLGASELKRSSLNAVGLIAAIAGRLAHAGISVNAVSAYFHDYLFVPTDKADEAMRFSFSSSRGLHRTAQSRASRDDLPNLCRPFVSRAG